jgi:acyl-CoA hydrolase
LVIVTEYGIADLRGLTIGEKAMAIARIAHPRYSDDFMRYVYEDQLFTKPIGFSLDKTPKGVILYEGRIRLESES